MTKLPDVFRWDRREMFRTYSSYARGGNLQLGTCAYLDPPRPVGRRQCPYPAR